MVKIQKMDFAIVMLFGITISAVLYPGFNHVGLGWDEGFYFNAGSYYLQWLKHPSISTIDTYWIISHEHPPLHKVLAGMTKWIFSDVLHLFEPIAGYRISTILFAFIATGSLYILALDLFGRFEAVVSCMMLLFIPRVFEHAQLVSLDFSSLSMWLFLSLMIWKSWTTHRGYVFLGFISGLAVLTKINAIFALFSWFVLLMKKYCLINNKKVLKTHIHFWKNESLILFGKILVPCLLVMIIGWPWLWLHPYERLLEFIAFHFHHYTLPTYYLGHIYISASPPWHYPFMMLFVTTPVIIFMFIMIGLIFLIPKFREDKVLFLLTNALLPMLLVSFSLAKYDGVRLFMPSFPFLMLIAAHGLRVMMGFIKNELPRKIAMIFAAIFIMFYLVIINKQYYPFAGSYFSEAIGGMKGAEKMGFDIHYWCSSYQSTLKWIEANKDKKYWIQFCYHLFDDYQTFGKIDWKIIKAKSPEEADYWIIVNRRGFIPTEMYNKLNQIKPVMQVKTHDVGLVSIYRKDDI